MYSEWFYGMFLDLTTFSPLVTGWFYAQIQFLQTELFSSSRKLIFPVNTILILETSLGRNSSPAPIYSIPRHYVFPGAAFFCFYLYFCPCKRCQEAEVYPTYFTYRGPNNAVKDISASNTKHMLFIWKAVTRDGGSIAGTLAKHLQANFIVSPARGPLPPSRWLPFPGQCLQPLCTCPSSGPFPKWCHPCLFNTFCSTVSSGSRIQSEAADNSLLCCWHSCRSCGSPYFFF